MSPYETIVNCPKCHDTKGHLGINTQKRVFNCFKCGYKGTLREWEEKHGKIRKNAGCAQRREVVDPTRERPELVITPLWDRPQHHATRYLHQRGLTQREIYSYQCGTVNLNSYSGYLIIPFPDQDYWIARDYTGLQVPKYLNPPKDKGFKSRSEVIYNLPSNYPFTERVVLCEGCFGAMWVQRGLELGKAIAILGKHMAQQQVSLLLDTGVREVLVFLDRDAEREQDKLVRRLCRKGISATGVNWKTIPPGVGEPDGMAPGLLTRLLSNHTQ